MKDYKKSEILIITNKYLPGYKAGGPIKSVKNIVDFYGDKYNFRIIAKDRDSYDKKPYDNVKVCDWNEVGKAKVYYVPPHGYSYKLLKKTADESDALYLCGVFADYDFKILVMKKLGLIKCPVIIAPQGSFENNAYHIKHIRKKVFIKFALMIGLFNDINWHGSTDIEIDGIANIVKANKNKCYIARNLVDRPLFDHLRKDKAKGTLEVFWLGRIHPQKNLKGALETLQNVKSNVNFHIYGPINDQDYYAECVSIADKLPSNITYKFEGAVKSTDVVRIISKHHVYLFETFSENFGHTIPEALEAGCPCILSDQTPWKDFEEKNVGYVFPLVEKNKFTEAIEHYAEMGTDDFNIVCEDCIRYYKDLAMNQVRTSGYSDMFDKVLHKGDSI